MRACLECPGWLSQRDEGRLRYALSLARLTDVRASDGRDVDLADLLRPLRTRLTETLSPLLLDRRGVVNRPEIGSLLPILTELAREHRDRLKEETRDLIAWEDIDAEIRNKILVLACGGGGGSGYVYLGAFQTLEDRGITPSLISGTSIGGILGAFRARSLSFNIGDVPRVFRTLAWGGLFKPSNSRGNYGLPGPLRLDLRDGIGRFFRGDGSDYARLKDLPIPLIVMATGIRQGELPHEPEWYEHRLDLEASALGKRRFGARWARDVVRGLWRAVSDLAQRPGALRSLVLGADGVTRSYDVLDAIGFSAAVPGVIHYDLHSGSKRMAGLLDQLFEQRQLLRLTDGALVDNVPARAAWRAVQSGRLGRRNALVLAMDAFAPKLTQPMWIPLQRMARPNVLRSIRYAHIIKTFTRTLSPLEVVPPPERLQKAIQWGREELAHEMPLVERLLAPLPDI